MCCFTWSTRLCRCGEGMGRPRDGKRALKYKRGSDAITKVLIRRQEVQRWGRDVMAVAGMRGQEPESTGVA